LTGTIEIGGRAVRRIGLGTNRLTDTEQNREFVRDAVASGIDFIDTARLYTGGDSERTIGAALSSASDGVVVTTKGGYHAADPDTLRREFAESLASLGTDSIFLYQLHRVDKTVPLEESMQVLSELQNGGRITHIGLSEVTVEQIERAQQVAPVVSVQNEYNLSERRHDAVVDYAADTDLAFIPYFPLRHSRSVEARLEEVAPRYGATTAQVALAWLLRRSQAMLPIPGTLSRDHVEENLGALDLELSDEDFEVLA
jgi:pyridoxine 4-dehydrogenase